MFSFHTLDLHFLPESVIVILRVDTWKCLSNHPICIKGQIRKHCLLQAQALSANSHAPLPPKMTRWIPASSLCKEGVSTGTGRMLTATDFHSYQEPRMTQSTAAPHSRGNSRGRGASREPGGSRQGGRGAALRSRPFSRPPVRHPGLPGPRRPQPAPPLAPVPGKSRPARGGRGSLPAGALRGAVLPAEGPGRGVSERVWGTPAEPLRHLRRPTAVPGSSLMPQGARAGKLRPS